MPLWRYDVNVRMEKIDAFNPDAQILQQAARLIAKLPSGAATVCSLSHKVILRAKCLAAEDNDLGDCDVH